MSRKRWRPHEDEEPIQEGDLLYQDTDPVDLLYQGRTNKRRLSGKDIKQLQEIEDFSEIY